MTIQDTIIQALEASYNAHRAALARIDVLASERPGLVSRIAELEAEVGTLRSEIAQFGAEETAHLQSIQSLVADLAKAVEKTKSVLGEARTAPTDSSEPARGGQHRGTAPTAPDETDQQAPLPDAVAEPLASADSGTDPQAPSPHGEASSVNANTGSEPKAQVRGSLDFVTKDIIWGWVQDIDNQMEQITVLLKYDGREIARTIASGYRSDLHQDGIGDGCYGYSFNVENHLLPQGRHNVEMFYLVAGLEIRAQDDKLQSVQNELRLKEDASDQ